MDHLEFAFKALDHIQPTLRENFGNPERVEKKSDGSLVTNVDPEVERVLRELIQAQFPEHGVIGEEMPNHNPEAEFQWIIDPVDGTRDYIHGIPVYGAILALYQNGEPLLGLIDVPETGSRYHAIKGGGAFWNNKPIHIQDCAPDQVMEGVLAMSNRRGFVNSGTTEAYDALCQLHPNALTLPNCYGHGLAARGAATAMINFNISLWDIASTKLLIEEAGGKFSVRKRGDKYDLICGKPTVVEWLKAHFQFEETGLGI